VRTLPHKSGGRAKEPAAYDDTLGSTTMATLATPDRKLGKDVFQQSGCRRIVIAPLGQLLHAQRRAEPPPSSLRTARPPTSSSSGAGISWPLTNCC